jgi:hypothetical protein
MLPLLLVSLLSLHQHQCPHCTGIVAVIALSLAMDNSLITVVVLVAVAAW